MKDSSARRTEPALIWKRCQILQRRSDTRLSPPRPPLLAAFLGSSGGSRQEPGGPRWARRQVSARGAEGQRGAPGAALPLHRVTSGTTEDGRAATPRHFWVWGAAAPPPSPSQREHKAGVAEAGLSPRLRGAAEHTKAAPRPRGAQPSLSPHLPLAAQRARAGRSGPPVHPGLPAGGGRASGSAAAAARGSGRAGGAAAPLPPGPSPLPLASLRPAPSRARQWRIAAASGGRRRRRPPRRAAHPAAPRPFIWDLRRGEEEEEEKKEEAAAGWVSPLAGVSAISPLHGKGRGGESRRGHRQRGVPTGGATAPRAPRADSPQPPLRASPPAPPLPGRRRQSAAPAPAVVILSPPHRACGGQTPGEQGKTDQSPAPGKPGPARGSRSHCQ